MGLNRAHVSRDDTRLLSLRFGWRCADHKVFPREYGAQAPSRRIGRVTNASHDHLHPAGRVSASASAELP